LKKRILILIVLLNFGLTTGIILGISCIPNIHTKNNSLKIAGDFYTLYRTTTCKNMQKSSPYDPIEETNRFTPQDEYCYVWMQLNYVYVNLSIKILWFTPDNELYRESGPQEIPHPSTEGRSVWGWYKAGTYISIKDHAAGEMEGDWRADIYIDEGYGYELVAIERFTIKTIINEGSSNINVIPIIIVVVSLIGVLSLIISTIIISIRVTSKIREWRFYRQKDKIRKVELETELWNRIKTAQKLTKDGDYLKAINNLNEVMQRAKNKNFKKVFYSACKNLKFSEQMEKARIEKLEAKNFVNLIKKGEKLTKSANREYSNRNFYDAIEKWKEAIKSYYLALEKASTSKARIKIEENLKNIQENIINAYFKKEKYHNKNATEVYKSKEFERAEKEWNSAKNDIEMVKNILQSEKSLITKREADIILEELKMELKNIQLNLMLINFEKKILEIDKDLERATFLEDKELAESINIANTCIVNYSVVKNEVKKYNEFLDLTKKIQTKMVSTRKYQNKLQNKLDKLIGIIPAIEQEIITKAKAISESSLYAKVVLLGESSVGKTHLVLTMTGEEYLPTQGSTVGVNKYYKPVKTSLKEYDTQLCFWDLGGQWNFRAVNELFLNEAAVILLVFDVTRPDTFEALNYWYDMVRKTRCPAIDCMFIVGNKLDVGGNAIQDEVLTNFLKTCDISKYYQTSAKTGVGVKTLLEDLAGAIDWSSLIKEIDTKIMGDISRELKKLSVQNNVMKTTELINNLVSIIPDTDQFLIKAALKRYASQDSIQINRSEVFILLKPEETKKYIDNLISMAANSDGIISFEEVYRNWKYNKEQLKVLFQFLESENVCYPIKNRIWVFPNVRHKAEPELEHWTQIILNSDPQTMAYKISGPDDLIFSRLTVNIAREYGAPENQSGFLSNTAGLWIIGHGHEQTALLIQFNPSKTGSVIRYKAGGGKGKELLEQINELSKQLFAAYTSDYNLI